MLYVHGNNDADDAEHYVNHLMFAAFRKLDVDTGPTLDPTVLLSFKKPTTMAASSPTIFKITA